MEDQKCKVLGNDDFFGFVLSIDLIYLRYLVQIILGFLCFGALLFKRWRESPRRSWDVFFMDASKQGFGGGSIHIMNMAMAAFLGSLSPNVDECDWYFVNIVMDTTFGVLVSYLLVCAIQPFVIRCGGNAFGNYGSPPRALTWLGQTFLWMLICVLAKTVVCGVMVFAHPYLTFTVGLIFFPIIDFPKVKLIIVMIISPTILNALQFWVSDNFLMGSTNIPLQEEFEMASVRASIVDDCLESGPVFKSESLGSLSPTIVRSLLHLSEPHAEKIQNQSVKQNENTKYNVGSKSFDTTNNQKHSTFSKENDHQQHIEYNCDFHQSTTGYMTEMSLKEKDKDFINPPTS